MLNIKAVVLALFMLLPSSALLSAEQSEGYWYNSAGEIWRNSAGECWQSRFLTPENSLPECTGEVVDNDLDKDGVENSVDSCPNTPAGASVNAKGCQLDSDGDGVVDMNDKCSGSPAGVAVDTRGCQLDSDGDGVVDANDKCPGTTRGTAVDTKGCPLDSDGDGIIDTNDKCPGTIVGDKVDAEGCGILNKTKEIVLENVNFKTGSAQLTASSSPILNQIATILTANPAVKVEIGGHTDNRGRADMNKKLSLKRAESVRNYLVDKGVAAAQLSVMGYGDAQPIADNGSKKGRLSNRRVELKVQ